MAKRKKARTRHLTRHDVAPVDGASRRRVLIVLALLGAGLLAYGNSLFGAFVFDDTVAILKNRHIKYLWPIEHWLGARRPVVALSLAINYRIGDFEPFGYHVFNLGVHLLASLVLFGVVRRSAVLIRSGSLSARSSDWFAGLVALCWVVHPLGTQAVTYVIQRGESLMALFYLLTLYCMIRGAQASRPGRWYGLSIVCCGLGMGSKAVMVTAPLMMVLYDRLFLCRSFGEVIRRRWHLHLGLASTWIVLGLCGVAGAVIAPPPTAAATVGFGFKGVTPAAYALSQPAVILHYLRLVVWPVGQCLDYGWPVVDKVAEAVAPGLVILALLVATVWALRRRRWLGFAGAWFFVILSPTSSFIPIRDLAFEHRMYLPLAAVIVMALAGAGFLLKDGFSRLSIGPGGRRVVMVALAICSVFALGVATHRRNALYRDPVLIWQDTIAKAPHNRRPYNALAWVYLEKDQNAEAIRGFRDAVAVDPDYAEAHANLAGVLLQEGDYPGAIAECRKVLQLDPAGFGAELYIRLATAHLLRGDNAEAIKSFRDALRIDPRGCGEHVYLNLGTALLNLGRVDEAIMALQSALRMNADYDMAYFSLGNARLQSGDVPGAIDAYRDAVRVNPGYADAFVRLGIALNRNNLPQQAMDSFRKGLAAVSGQTSAWVPIEAHFQIGKVLLAQGRNAEAAESFGAALRIDPGHTDARDGLRAAESSP